MFNYKLYKRLTVNDKPAWKSLPWFMVNSLWLLVDTFPSHAEDDIRDIKPPVDLPPDYFLLYALLGCLVIVGFFFLIRFILPRLKRPKKIFVPEKKDWETALERLNALQKRNLLNQGQIKEYYSELSDIVRLFIEDRFLIRAPEMTTQEFLFSLKDSRELTAEQKGFLKDFLNACDMVKFAKYSPDLKEGEEGFRLAVKLVEETKIISE